VEECLDDIQLIWTNCKTYNADFSKIFKLASKLESVTKKLVKEHFPSVKNYGRTNQTLEALRKDDFLQLEEHEEVPYQEKVRISQKVKELNQEQLGEVVARIKGNCPQAFKEFDKDTCQIFVDNIPKTTLEEIAKFIDSCVADEWPSAKKLKR